MRGRVVALTVLHLAGAGFLGAIAWDAGMLGLPSVAVVPFAVAIAAVGSRQMNVEFGRHACWVTMVEAVVVSLLLYLEPAGVLVAAVLGEVLTCAWQRQSPLKLLFNAGTTALAAMVAVIVFGLLQMGGDSVGATWVAALVATCCYATATHASTSTVLAIVEGRRFRQVFSASLAPVAAASVVSATLGLVAVVLIRVTPGAILLLAPLLLVMVGETRRLATHRAEHLRFERLYAASSRTGNLQSLPDVLGSLADEARGLVTGAAAVCCTVDRTGAWQGVVVDDTGARPAPGDLVSAILAASQNPAAEELSGESVPAVLGELLDSTESVVVARSEEGAAAPVVLGVLRQLAGDDGARGRADVLGAFMGHAALTVANARLYADVEEALAHQVDLNRQKDDFVAVVSHELRTPLAAMIGSVSTMRRMEARLGAEQRTMLVDMALRQGERLQRLIEELLLLATVEHGGQAACKRETIDLRHMVEEISRVMADQRRDQNPPDVRFVCDDVLPSMHTDEQKLHQVLCNLVENASKYAPGSPVTVKAGTEGGQVVIEVIDRGPGIKPDDRERVFERFVQLDQSSTRAQGGTGIGLYLCRQIAGLLGGTLTLSEAVGGGCCFTLKIPAVLVELAEEERPLRDAPQLADATSSGRAPS